MYWINSPLIKSNIYFNDLKIINNKVEASCKICRNKNNSWDFVIIKFKTSLQNCTSY